MAKLTIKPVDWFKIFYDLKVRGLSLYDIRDAIGIPKTTLLDFKAGREPRHNDGELLLEYWMQVTKNSRELVHRLDIYSRK